MPPDGKVLMLLRKALPLIVAVAILWASVALIARASMARTRGNLVYALDDPYIHMAIAKNMARHGVWGVTEHRHTGSSSSMLWSLLLWLAYLLFGPSELAPLILNLLFATGLLAGAYWILRRSDFTPRGCLLGLLLIQFLAPLAPIVFCGMEHMLHGLLVLVFAYLAGKELSGNSADLERSSSGGVALCALAPLLVMARYEGAFMILVVCLLLTARRRIWLACLTGLLGALPVIVSGLVWMSKGWYFLPNSVLLKGNSPDPTSIKGLSDLLGGAAWREIARNPHVLMLVVLSVLAICVQYQRHRKFRRLPVLLNALFLGTTFLHMQFARAGWFYRYEAYLMALGIVAIVVSLRDYVPEKLKRLRTAGSPLRTVLIVALGAYVTGPIIVRGVLSHLQTPQATANIHDQQYQMGRFLRKYYQGRTIAANDIGAINFLADIRCLDLWGLANPDVARLRATRQYKTGSILTLARAWRVDVAMVYDSWFKQYGGLPPQWIRVAKWKVRRHYKLGRNTVSIYATDAHGAAKLRTKLREFEAHLPDSVEVIYEPEGSDNGRSGD